MPTTWESLPLEVWISTFALLDMKDLSQSRLVCKVWDPLAEKAMFSQTLVFPTDKKLAAKLHYHLARKPFLGRCIKEVTIGYSFLGDTLDFTDPLMADLCRFVFTPSIEKIGGMSLDDHFYKLLLEIMDDSPQEFSHLKEITAGEKKSPAFSQVLCRVKDTIQYMILAVSPTLPTQVVVDCLDEFVKLKEIHLILENLVGIEAIDNVLRKLQSAESMTLKVMVSDNFSTKTKREMNAWLAQHVEKNEKMKTVLLTEIGDELYTSNVVDYVIHKYSNLETLRLAVTDMGRHLDRVFQSMEQVPQIHMCDTCTREPADLWMVGNRFKSTTNKVEIRYSLYNDFPDENGAIVDITKTNSTQHTDFDITLTPDASHAFAKQLLSSVCTGTSDIVDLDINLYLYKDPRNESEHLMSFHNILKMTPHLKKLEFCDEGIKHQTTGLDTLTLNDLTQLRIFATKIDAGVLPYISKIAPRLHSLDLSSCYLLDEDGEYRHSMNIDMPHSALDRIAIETGNHSDTTDYSQRQELKKLERMEDMINEIGNIYLCVKTEGSLEYFVLEAYENIVNKISREEYDLHSKGSAIIHINCKTLTALYINLDNHNFNMTWDAHGTLHTRNNVRESSYLALKRKYDALQEMMEEKNEYFGKPVIRPYKPKQ